MIPVFFFYQQLIFESKKYFSFVIQSRSADLLNRKLGAAAQFAKSGDDPFSFI